MNPNRNPFTWSTSSVQHILDQTPEIETTLKRILVTIVEEATIWYSRTGHFSRISGNTETLLEHDHCMLECITHINAHFPTMVKHDVNAIRVFGTTARQILVHPDISSAKQQRQYTDEMRAAVIQRINQAEHDVIVPVVKMLKRTLAHSGLQWAALDFSSTEQADRLFHFFCTAVRLTYSEEDQARFINDAVNNINCAAAAQTQMGVRAFIDNVVHCDGFGISTRVWKKQSRATRAQTRKMIMHKVRHLLSTQGPIFHALLTTTYQTKLARAHAFGRAFGDFICCDLADVVSLQRREECMMQMALDFADKHDCPPQWRDDAMWSGCASSGGTIGSYLSSSDEEQDVVDIDCENVIEAPHEWGDGLTSSSEWGSDEAL